MPPAPRIATQLSSRFQALAVIVTIIGLAWIFFSVVLPEWVVKSVYWSFDALFSVAVLYFVGYWWRWKTIPPFLQRNRNSN